MLAGCGAKTSGPSKAVTIKDFLFDPQNLTVTKGTTVTWTNQDGLAHTVNSDEGTTLNSGNILPNGGKWSYKFDTAGTFPYHCAPHPTMTGMVTVTA